MAQNRCGRLIPFVPTRTAPVQRLFAGINSMLPAAIFLLTPVQQQSWTNGNDGLWRWMPSIAADQNGNVAIGYSTSSPSIFPSIRYAGRLAIDALNNLAQGEADNDYWRRAHNPPRPALGRLQYDDHRSLR